MVSLKYNTQGQLTFLGLRHNPFAASMPDDANFHITRQAVTVIERLESAILTRKGILLLTGEDGLGKTTIAQRIAVMLEEKNVATSLVQHPHYQKNDLLRAINRNFGIIDLDTTFSGQMELLSAFLVEKNKNGINCAIIIDDAEFLPAECFELIEMISNFDGESGKPVQILLVGETELKENIAIQTPRNLKIKIAVQEEPAPLARTQLQGYLRFKLNTAENNDKISIEKQAVKKLFSLSKGNCGRINVIMSQALDHAFMEKTLTIRKKFIEDVFFEETQNRSAWKNPFLSVSVFAFLLMVIGATVAGYYFYNNRIKPLKSIITDPLPAVVVTKEIPAPVQREPVPAPPAPPAEIIPSLNDPVIKFLEGYHLSDFETEFSKALDNDTLPQISKAIFSRTGLELIQFKSIPPALQNKYHILAIESDHPIETLYYLFWKPALVISNYSQGYRGEEIKKLQMLLKNMNLYDYNLDGIVGSKCTNGIIRFQTQNNLEATGFPDPLTLFLLAGLSRPEE